MWRCLNVGNTDKSFEMKLLDLLENDDLHSFSTFLKNYYLSKDVKLHAAIQ